MRKNKRWIRSLVGWILSLTILLNPLQGVVYAAGDVGAIAQEAEGLQVHVIFDDTSDRMEFVRAQAPKKLPDWNNLP